VSREKREKKKEEKKKDEKKKAEKKEDKKPEKKEDKKPEEKKEVKKEEKKEVKKEEKKAEKKDDKPEEKKADDIHVIFAIPQIEFQLDTIQNQELRLPAFPEPQKVECVFSAEFRQELKVTMVPQQIFFLKTFYNRVRSREYVRYQYR